MDSGLSLYELAVSTPTDVVVSWRSTGGIVRIGAGGFSVYLSELEAVPHSPFWDGMAKMIRALANAG